MPIPPFSPPLPSSDPTPSAGEQRRRQVMGDAFVDRALAAASAFSAPLQAHVNDHAWGATWVREGLSLKERSLCTVAMLAALGHTHELKGHLQGALNNGATLAALREVLLHVAPYAGVPVTSAAFRAAEEWMAAQGLRFDAEAGADTSGSSRGEGMR